ncbi:MAG TPA: hypothetical protein VJB57_09015 [Dehalococcoidia bacterium]|nr:hypothetical protein [Dehalococcoidia bacterium]
MLSEDMKRVDGAFYEASLLKFDPDWQQRTVVVRLQVHTCKFTLRFTPVGRVLVHYRGRSGKTMKVKQERLPLLARLNWDSIYPDTFFDQHEQVMTAWGTSPSFEWRTGEDGQSHSFWIFQERRSNLDILLWFDDLKVFDEDEHELTMAELTMRTRECNARWLTQPSVEVHPE